MLPKRHKLGSSKEFVGCVRSRTRAGTTTVVAYTNTAGCDYVTHQPVNHSRSFIVGSPRGPRLGLIIAKSVGNAVARHKTARILRSIFTDILDEIPAGTDVVLRALPPITTATYEEITADVSSAIRRSLAK